MFVTNIFNSNFFYSVVLFDF
uniref:Uncharacterized protein n=1 Tax=Heterorhabditis bacteriophora TaxID=37862 RepID=A0A1I7X115_HETBA